MFTPEEIRNITFDKGVRGYRTEDVDAFLEQMASEREELESQKNDLEQKLYLLAQKVEEYRGQEDALRHALVNAQRMGDSVLQEARVKAEGILRDATTKAEQVLAATEARAQRENEAFTQMRQDVENFRNAVLELYKEHIELLSSLPGEDESLLPVHEEMLPPDEDALDVNGENSISEEAEKILEEEEMTWPAN